MDAVVVGAGPNGLAAAIELACAGRSVIVLERAAEVGGGTRTAELTLPGFRHDVCSAVHPLAIGSPFLSGLALERDGLELAHPEIQAAHPLDRGDAVAVHRSPESTAAGLGIDGEAYASLIGPLARGWPALAGLALAPLGRVPRDPLLAARFGLAGLRSARGLAMSTFDGERARALLAGMAAHSLRPLNAPGTAAFGLVLLALAHAVGWPVARGGSQRITEAMRSRLESLGGVVETGREVHSLGELPDARAVLFDLTPRQLLAICGDALPRRYRAALARFRYGPGVFKLDYALSAPVPWRAPECHVAGTVHLGGGPAEIAASELAVARGGHPDRPFVLVAQQSVVDPSRAPSGMHTLWAYCHVPNGSSVDMTAAIEAQIERFAPGFAETVVARAARGPAQIEAENPNNVGGDINGGLASLRQTFARPAARLCPYATGNPKLFLCSSSTPPGGGVHGMCGYHAARAALQQTLR
ncbi:MAG: phytoene desaturase family protein [Solirubrobacteraceae bacterium]